jgi:hypothetical protein
MWEQSASQALDQVRCPVLAVLAEGRAGDARAADMLARKREGAARAVERLTGAASLTIHWLPDTVHDVPLHRPADLVALIETLAAAADARP